MTKRLLATTRRRGNWNCFRKPWLIGSGLNSRFPNTIAATFINRRKRRRWKRPRQISIQILGEISHKNPLWVNPADAKRLGDIRTGDLLKVHTEIGFFVLHAWVTEGLAPGVVACSHHMGRWRLNKDDQIERMSSAWVDLKEVGKGQWKMRQTSGVEPYETSDPDTKRVWWSDAGVHQNLTFPVHPDPITGMHCWHQMVRVERA